MIEITVTVVMDRQTTHEVRIVSEEDVDGSDKMTATELLDSATEAIAKSLVGVLPSS